jgi:MFS family permease
MSSLPSRDVLTSGRVGALVAMIASAAAVGAGLSLGLPLLALVLEGRGVGGVWIGLNTATAGIASVAITPFVTRLAIRFGALPLLVTALITTAVSFLGFYFASSLWMWFPLRLVFHGAINVAFVVSEFWIASLAPHDRRGLVMGIYATVLSLGFAVGPLILGLVGSAGVLPFLAGSAVILIATLPTLFARHAVPPLEHGGGHGSILGFVRAVPLATLAALVFGAVESGAMAILPIYGLRLGFSEAEAALLVTAAALGNVALQIPIGIAADRTNRIGVLIGCAVVGLVGALLIPVVAHDFTLLLAVLFVWAGTLAGLYTVGLTHLGARYAGADLASVNATFVMMYAVGMMVGPPAIGAGLDAVPPHGAAHVMAAIFALYLAVAAVDLARHRRGGRRAA